MTTPSFLYCDIETSPSSKEPKEVSLPKEPTKDDVKVGNRKGEVAEAYREEQLPALIIEWRKECNKAKNESEQELRKESLNPLKGKILCVGYAFDDQAPEIISGDEKQMLSIFESILLNYGEKHLGIPIVGFNLKNFDLEFLMHRAIKYKKQLLYRYLKNVVVIDLSEEFKFNKYNRNYYKFDDLLKFYGFDGKPSDIDGSKVYDYWIAGRNEEIYSYCAGDVIMTRQLHKILKSVTR